MQLLILNGSAREKNSNTKILLEHFLRGFSCEVNNEYNTQYLYQGDYNKCFNLLETSDYVLLAYPLYADSMPGLVKEFMEYIAPLRGKIGNLKMAFIVQSGYREGIHSLLMERYNEKFCRRLGCQYLGTVTKGGVEGIKIRSDRKNKKLYENFYNLGKIFGKTGVLDISIKHQLRKPMRFSIFVVLMIRILNVFGIIDKKWNDDLKKNNTFAHRFDRPYL